MSTWHIDQLILDRLDAIIANTGGKNGRRKTYNVTTVEESPGQLQIGDTANTTFYNLGTATAVILGNIPLATGQGIAFPVNENEQDMTKYTFTFTGAGTRSLLIIQRLYTNE